MRWVRVPLAKPSYLRKILSLSEAATAIVHNAGWISANRILFGPITLFVGIWMARCLGPKKFGVYSYVLALTGLFRVIGRMGLDDVVIREIVRGDWTESQALGTTFTLRATGGLCAAGGALLATAALRPHDHYIRLLVGIASLAMLFQATEAVEFWLQARLKAKLAFMISGPTVLITTALRLGLLLGGASLAAFVWVLPFGALLSAVGLVGLYWNFATPRQRWTFNGKLTIEMLRSAVPLFLSSAAILVYMRIDQIMLGSMASDKVVGIYAAAVKISEAWYFVPLAMTASAFPSLVKAKKSYPELYNQRLLKLLRMLAALSYGVCLLGTLLSGVIVRRLYGPQYAEAVPVLATLFWAGPSVALGLVAEKWRVIENLTWFSFFSTGLGALINVLLNLLWIRKYGALGAAWATVVAYSLAGIVVTLAFRPTRPIGWMMLKGMALMSP
jgi:PST family polysaccharide transporter